MSKRAKIILGVVAAVIVIGAIASSGDDEDSTDVAATDDTSAQTQSPVDTEAPAVTTTTEPEPTTTTLPGFGEGTHVVGTDVQPGTYRSAGGDLCYWARLSGLSGSFDEIIANNAGSGPAVVAIAPTDAAIETSGCARWELAG